MVNITQEHILKQAPQSTSLSKHLLFIGEQINFHEKRAEAFEGGRKKLHLETASKLKALSDELSKLYAAVESGKTKPPALGHQLSLSLEDIDGLPPELVQELSISNTDRTEFACASGPVQPARSTMLGVLTQKKSINFGAILDMHALP